MIDPSNTSVIWKHLSFNNRLECVANLADLSKLCAASIISTLKVWTYSSSIRAIPDSVETLAIRRAVSCRIRSGDDSSSFSRTCASDYVHDTSGTSFERRRERTFSWKTKQLNRAAHCSGESGLNTPPNIISVKSNSSPVLISHATRPFISTTSSDVVKPSLRRTRLRDFSSSS